MVANDEVEDAPTDDSEDEPSLPSSGEKRKTRGGGKGKKKVSNIRVAVARPEIRC